MAPVPVDTALTVAGMHAVVVLTFIQLWHLESPGILATVLPMSIVEMPEFDIGSAVVSMPGDRAARQELLAGVQRNRAAGPPEPSGRVPSMPHL